MSRYDVLVIGASIGGLAAAAYLSRAGRRVLLLEAGPAPGELTESLFALDPQLVSELKLISHGLRFAQRDLPLTLMLQGGPPLTLSRDRHATAQLLAGFDAADAKAFAPFRQALMDEARRLRRFWWSGLKQGAPEAMLDGRRAQEDFARLCLSGADAWLRARLRSDALVTALLWDATGGGFHPSEPGSALALMWRAAQEMAGLQGAVALAERGTLITALRTAAEGAEMRFYTPVTRIAIEQGAVRGVTLEDGESIAAPLVLSALPRAATLALTGSPLPRPAEVGEAQLLLTLNEPLALAPARYLIAERPELYLDAHEEARAAKIPAELPVEFLALDAQRLAVTVRPLPAVEVPDWRAQVAARAIRAMARQLPGLVGAINHIAFSHRAARASLPQLLAPAGTRVRSGVEGLYLCGADAEPVSCLSGRAGRIAASFALNS